MLGPGFLATIGARNQVILAIRLTLDDSHSNLTQSTFKYISKYKAIWSDKRKKL